MHTNYHASDMSYDLGEITAGNAVSDLLSATLLPAAEQAFRAAVLRRSAEAGAETLAGWANRAPRRTAGLRIKSASWWARVGLLPGHIAEKDLRTSSMATPSTRAIRATSRGAPSPLAAVT